MTSVSESLASAGGPLNAALVGGLRDISQNATVQFTLYQRIVLPLDGFVFWVRADLLGPSAIVDGGPLNSWEANLPPAVETSAAQRKVKGSFHFSTEQTMNPAESYAVNRVIFTSEEEVPFLNEIAPGSIWIGNFPADSEGNVLKFSFSAHGKFYEQAGIWHYTGHAVYATMLTQLVDDVAQLNTRDVVVSNSLPFWLSLGTPGLPVFPSYLVPDNQVPPYIAAHIGPDDTTPLQPVPRIDPQTSSHWQLASDRVSLAFYGLRNFGVIDFIDRVLRHIGDAGDPVGLMGYGAIVQDEKRGQVELGALAQAKRIQIEVSYYQSRIRDRAWQVILKAVPSYLIEGLS